MAAVFPLPPSYLTYPMNTTVHPYTSSGSTWSSWRQPSDSLLTPPRSSSPPQLRVATKQKLTLPPISYFDQPLSLPHESIRRPQVYDSSNFAPVTPPDSAMPSRDAFSSSLRVPSMYQSKPSMPTAAPHLVDWFNSSQKRSAQFIAEKTCEMVCYLWFSSTLGPARKRSSPRRRLHSLAPTPHHSSNDTPTALQLSASSTFIQFMHKLLETTQVSQSVIVLSLHYIYRLKERNQFTNGQSGSEFRVAVVALMMANKFVDDNTYTNKTWSEVSGIELTEINRMEREFLLGVDFRLFVDKTTYESWLNLLRGLVMAKERDSRYWQSSRRPTQGIILPAPLPSHYQFGRTPSQRARSTSPSRPLYSFTFAPPPHSEETHYSRQGSDSPAIARPGSKRSAADAFSPTSATFSQIRPLKRPVSLHLDIPTTRAQSGPSSAAPMYTPFSLEPLQSFADLSLGATSTSTQSRPASRTLAVPLTGGLSHSTLPPMLAAPYRMDDRGHVVAPQNLYFYTLACSPMESEEDSQAKKTRLRYQQVPPASAHMYSESTPPPHIPMVVQSASASPHDTHMSLAPPLHQFYDASWSHSNHSAATATQYLHSPEQPILHSEIPPAPFANAGPPGVHFYTTPASQSSPAYYHNRGSRSRRMW